MSPILPIRLKTLKPNHPQYPKQIISVGDEFRAARIDRELTQLAVANQLGVNRNFVYECELNHRTNSIYALHYISKFLGYIPKTLNIDETTLQGVLQVHRIRTGKTYKELSNKIGLDKSTLVRFEKGKIIKQESLIKITTFLRN